MRQDVLVKSWLSLAAGGAIVLSNLGGCTSARDHEARTAESGAATTQPAVAAADPDEPRLASSGDAQLTLFGEFPDRQRIPFHAQASSPMKQHTFENEGADFDVEVSPDGKSIVFASTRHTIRPNIYLKTVDGRAVTQLTDDPAGDVEPAFSPDGRQIAFASNRAGNWDIWMMSLQGGRATQITHSPQHEVHPTFSPDGKQIAYCLFNARADQWELWVLNLAQPDSRRMIGLGLFPDWSPKADSIVYQRARERGGRWFSIWRVDLENGEPRFPTELAARSEMALIQPTWSPDGDWITYGTAQIGTGGDVNESGSSTLTRGDIWMLRADGSSAVQLTDSGINFGSAWGPDERIYFTSLQNGHENIWSVRPLARSPEHLTVQPVMAPAGTVAKGEAPPRPGPGGQGG
jgi:TolB protein